MKTKKISINELRSIIKEIIKEEIEKTNKSVNEGFKSEYEGNDGIIWKKGKSRGGVTNFTPYYKGHNIDFGGYNFKTEKELKDYIENYILSIQLYNKYRFESVNEIQYDRYIVGYFNPQYGGGVEGMGMDGMMNDFDSYSKAKDYAKKAYKEDPNSIYVVMSSDSRKNHPIFTIGKKTPAFKNWLKNQ